MDVITPATLWAVETALQRDDQLLLAAYGRFLGPIGERLLAKTTDPIRRAQIQSLLDSTFKSYVARAAGCS